MNLKSLKELFWWWSGKQTWCQEPLSDIVCFPLRGEARFESSLSHCNYRIIINLFFKKKRANKLDGWKRALSQDRAFESLDGFLFMTWITFKIFYIFYFGLFIIFRGLIALFANGHSVKFILYGFELWHPSSLKKN